MTIFNQLFTKKILFIAMVMSMFAALVHAAVPKESVLHKYETNGFQCLDISATINEDTLKAYTDLTLLEDSDKVHVCVRVDLTQVRIAGNKYVFVFDQNGSLKAYNQIASILD